MERDLYTLSEAKPKFSKFVKPALCCPVTGLIPTAYLRIREQAMRRIDVGTSRAMRSLISWVFSPLLTFNESLFGDLSGLPPLFINAGEDDELYDDGKSFYLKAEQAGVEVIFHSGKRQVHCYPLLAPMFREATEAMKEIVDFVKFHLHSDATSA